MSFGAIFTSMTPQKTVLIPKPVHLGRYTSTGLYLSAHTVPEDPTRKPKLEKESILIL